MKTFNIWFDRVFSKNVVLVASLVVSIVPFVLPIPYNLLNQCSLSGCGGQYGALVSTFLPTVMVIVLFTLLTYLLRDGVFRIWIRFALLWLIFTGVYISQMSHNTGNALGIDARPWDIATIAVLFAILSLAIVAISLIKVYLLNLNK